MSKDSRLVEVFQSVLGGAVNSLEESDSLGHLDGWDSAGHLNLIMAIEAEFAVQFEIEEIEADSWREMLLTLIEPPEDCTGVYDNIESDDLGYSDLAARPENWTGVVAVVESDQ